ncbi:MAG TPA: urea carboxylase-associated family protein [Methylomirabilota bacterium]|nr:urea carboxylase-associated family protein [Methylomirabilota bacterium]
MKIVKEQHVPYNTGWAAEMNKGQVIRITATTTVDFVCMKLQNLLERFDQARTKVYNMKLFITTGDKLMGRNNQHMMTILADGFKNGTHDLQKGMCSGYRFQLAKQEGRLGEYYPRQITEIPDHGCYENLSRALAPYKIAPEDIPSPFNLNQHMKIDGATGRMEHTQIRPNPGNYMDLRAEMDLLAAFSACPDLPVGGKPVDVMIYAP